MYQVPTRKNGNSSLEENGQMINESGDIDTAILINIKAFLMGSNLEIWNTPC
jgi:hypothetical protein